jgi:uncharacterized iron-regulated membrane protein
MGLALGALLYVVCLSGTLTVFYAHFERWEQPRIEERLDFSPTQLRDAAEAALARLATPPETLYLVLPTALMPRLHIHAVGSEEEWFVTPEGELGTAVAAPWSQFVQSLHVRLQLPETWGVILVGIAGVMLCALLLSGVLAHPGLVRDAFRWRSGASGRLFQVDLHNRLGVWGLPFYLMIALTGAFMGLAAVFYSGYAAVLYDGDRQAVYDLVYGADIKPDEPLDVPLDLGRALTQLQAREPAAEPIYIALQHMRTPQQHVEIAAMLPNRLVYSEIYRFTLDGEYINHQALSDGPAGRQLAYSVYRLHFGQFGAWPVRLGYGLLGLGLTVLCVSGMSLWLMKQPDRTWVNDIWMAWVWGWPLGLAVAALTALNGHLPWIGLLVALSMAWGISLFLCDAARLKRLLIGMLGMTLLTVLLTHLLRFGLVPGNPASLAVNAALFVAAGLAGLWVLRSTPLHLQGAAKSSL